VRSRQFRLSAIIVVVVAIALGVALTVQPGGQSLATTLDDTTEAVAAFLAAGFTALAARREHGRPRLAWAALCGYATVWGAGQTLWLWKEVILQQHVPGLWWTDALFLGSSVLALGAAVLFQPAAQTALARLRGFLDGLLIGTALLLVGWAAVLGRVFDVSGVSVLQKVVMLAYPLGDVVVLTVIVTAALRMAPRARASLVLVTMGIAGILVADWWYALQNAAGVYSGGTPFDGMWTTGFLAIALGGLATVLGGHSETQRAASSDEQGRFGRYLPILMVTVACVATVTEKITTGHTGWVVLAAMVSLVLLASVRQLVTLADNMGMARRLAEEASSDALTGLLNRREFHSRLLDALCAADQLDNPRVALLYIDIDGFKAVNDSHGHAAGDVLLTTVARRLLGTVRAGDIVGRIGGDEFAVLLQGEDVDTAAVHVADRVIARLREPVHLAEVQMMVSASVGIALADRDDTPETLVGHADVAMYRAKTSGRDRHEVFDADAHRAVVGRMRLQADLRVALEKGEFILHYQPIVDLAGGRVVGVEALARWAHPQRGLLRADDFVPLAEEAGATVELGRQLLREACRQAAQWQEEGLFYVSVNVTARQLRQAVFVTQVFEALSDAGLPPQALVLEVTESDVMEEGNAVDVALTELRRHGIRIAMDDFGTGYSSLSNLCRIPVDILKTDGIFVRSAVGSTGALVASAILALGRSLGLTMVAEGIEDEERARIVAAMGYRYGQGYHLGRPGPADQLAALGFLPRTADLPAR
jgi:diguanylate cyclase